jgi:hypothetical protein
MAIACIGGTYRDSSFNSTIGHVLHLVRTQPNSHRTEMRGRLSGIAHAREVFGRISIKGVGEYPSPVIRDIRSDIIL